MNGSVKEKNVKGLRNPAAGLDLLERHLTMAGPSPPKQQEWVTVCK
jgi:hypothetical protein